MKKLDFDILADKERHLESVAGNLLITTGNAKCLAARSVAASKIIEPKNVNFEITEIDSNVNASVSQAALTLISNAEKVYFGFFKYRNFSPFTEGDDSIGIVMELPIGDDDVKEAFKLILDTLAKPGVGYDAVGFKAITDISGKKGFSCFTISEVLQQNSVFVIKWCYSERAVYERRQDPNRHSGYLGPHQYLGKLNAIETLFGISFERRREFEARGRLAVTDNLEVEVLNPEVMTNKEIFKNALKNDIKPFVCQDPKTGKIVLCLTVSQIFVNKNRNNRWSLGKGEDGYLSEPLRYNLKLKNPVTMKYGEKDVTYIETIGEVEEVIVYGGNFHSKYCKFKLGKGKELEIQDKRILF